VRPDRQRSLWGRPATTTGAIVQDVALATARPNTDAKTFDFGIPQHGLFAVAHTNASTARLVILLTLFVPCPCIAGLSSAGHHRYGNSLPPQETLCALNH
jgi:hypothetical protein